MSSAKRDVTNHYLHPDDETKPCPRCGYPIGEISGMKSAICTNCGYKDPCCNT